ncbi:SS4 [Scenedesmus sp. PABB004]|nr:SS4 [Scenedesmus sp. PABB004]
MAGAHIAQLAWRLQAELAAKPAADGSGAFASPLSLALALALALRGAGSGSATQQELYHLLHQDKGRLLGLLAPAPASAADVDALLASLAALFNGLRAGAGEGCELVLANGVWTNKIAVRPEYAAAMLAQFEAEVAEAQSTDIINAWAERVTKGLIKVAVPPGTKFDLVLTNAVYFKGLWAHAFKKEATSTQPFRLEGGGEAQVELMSRAFKASDMADPGTPKVMFAQKPGAYSAVRLPYKGTSIVAVAVLPDEGLAKEAGGVAAAAARLPMAELLSAASFERVGGAGLHVALPRFKVASSEPASLKGELVKLGVRGAFDPDAADFSALSPTPLYISDVLQSVRARAAGAARPRARGRAGARASRDRDRDRAARPQVCVIVDEEGTEAAAVTAVTMMRCAAFVPTPVLRFDRPFLFMLVDDATPAALQRRRGERRLMARQLTLQADVPVGQLHRQAPSVVALLPLVGAPGDLIVHQGAVDVVISYKSAGRPLHDAARLWAHVGHSGWQSTEDVELFRSPGDPGVWTGIYRLPACQLANATHAEVQMVMAELSHNEGLVTPPEISPSAVSGLLLLVQALRLKGLLSVQQEELLRTLTCQHDTRLLRAYGTVRSWLDDAAAAGRLLSQTMFARRPGVHVVHVASEMVPIAKVGGLGDVVTSLAKAHQASGAVIEVVMPKYDNADYGAIDQLRRLTTFNVAWAGGVVAAHAWCGVVEGLPVYLIEADHPAAFFWRGRFYGEPDDCERFMFFSRAALEFLLAMGKQPDVLHCHDWQSALVAPLLELEFRGRGLSRPRSVLTIHNIAFQARPGWMTPDVLRKAGLPSDLAQPHLLLDDSRPGFAPDSHDVSLLRGGVVFADRVTTVSPTYAREVFDPAFGHGMQARPPLAPAARRVPRRAARRVPCRASRHARLTHQRAPARRAQSVLSAHASKFSGVLNGIDQHMWSPSADPHLPPGGQFSAHDTRGKAVCKAALLAELGMPHARPDDEGAPGRRRARRRRRAAAAGLSGGQASCGCTAWLLTRPNARAPADGAPGRPLLAIVSRLTEQKGLALMLHGMAVALSRGAQLVVLGSASEPDVAARFEALQAAHHGGPDARLILRYDEALAHRIYAAADMILIPSLFEPCGLTQLIALRYGTIPIVNATGGLADTVRDVANSSVPEVERNGFVFYGREPQHVEAAVHRALDAWWLGGEWWRGQLVPRAMRQDWSWSRSSQAYLDLYRSVMR